jgi:hypothetical protein
MLIVVGLGPGADSTPCGGQGLEKAENGIGRRLQKVGMD